MSVQSFLDKLVLEAKNALPEWSQDTESLEFMIDEALANLLHLQDEQVQSNQKELYLPSSTKKESAIKIVRVIDYNPRGSVPARGPAIAEFVKATLKTFFDSGNTMIPRNQKFNVSAGGTSTKAFTELDTVIPGFPIVADFMKIVDGTTRTANITQTMEQAAVQTASVVDAPGGVPRDWRTAATYLGEGELSVEPEDVFVFTVGSTTKEFKIQAVSPDGISFTIRGYDEGDQNVVDYQIRRRETLLRSANGTEKILKTAYANVKDVPIPKVYINNALQTQIQAGVSVFGEVNLSLAEIPAGSLIEVDYYVDLTNFTKVRLYLPLIMGERKTDFFTGTGENFQRHRLTNKNVVGGSIVVTVNGREFEEVTNFDQPSDVKGKMYQTELTQDEFVELVFPSEDEDGFVPDEVTNNIQADYAVGGGSKTNVAGGSVASVQYLPGQNPDLTTAGIGTLDLPSGATGGSDAETLESIKINAPALASTANRVVTALDYEIASEKFAGVHRARAIGDTPQNKAKVYITIKGSNGLAAAPTQALLDVLKAHLDKLSVLTVINEVNPPTLVIVYVRATFQTPIGKSIADGQSAVREFFTGSTVSFGQDVLSAFFVSFMLARGFQLVDGEQFYFKMAAPLGNETGVERIVIQDTKFPILETDVFPFKIKFLAPPVEEL